MTKTAPNAVPSLFDLEKMAVIDQTVSAIQSQTMKINSVVIPQEKKGLWDYVSFLLKNKFGLTKNDAKKLFYDMKNKGQKEEEPEQKQPETVEEKMNVIMGYMKETSAKLDHIVNDISYLKDQVEMILKKL